VIAPLSILDGRELHCLVPWYDAVDFFLVSCTLGQKKKKKKKTEDLIEDLV
jgi:hypothetical protein